ICLLYSVNEGLRASSKQTAFAVMVCMSGPPCMPGKTALSIACAYSLLHMIAPPRGPRRVLWVVVVVKLATPTEVGWTPVAQSPAMWAMSAMQYAPTPSAISWNALKSMVLGYADAPQTSIFG